MADESIMMYGATMADLPSAGRLPLVLLLDNTLGSSGTKRSVPLKKYLPCNSSYEARILMAQSAGDAMNYDHVVEVFHEH